MSRTSASWSYTKHTQRVLQRLVTWLVKRSGPALLVEVYVVLEWQKRFKFHWNSLAKEVAQKIWVNKKRRPWLANRTIVMSEFFLCYYTVVLYQLLGMLHSTASQYWSPCVSLIRLNVMNGCSVLKRKRSRHFVFQFLNSVYPYSRHYTPYLMEVGTYSHLHSQ